VELPQSRLIVHVKDKCIRDDRLDAALTYGSFTKGEGDRYSDIEFWLFFNDDQLDAIDQEQWINDVAPIHWSVINEYGTRVAFFKDHLIRGEFHFVSTRTMNQVQNWPAVEPERASTMIIVDHTNLLQGFIEAGEPTVPSSPDQIERLCGQYLNWLLFGRNVLKRGDLAQAHMILGMLQGYLIWMARLQEGSTQHWQTQSKGLEHEVTEKAYHRFIEVTAPCEAQAVARAYRSAWSWGHELIDELQHKYHFSIPSDLMTAIADYLP
jgi:lincosamide nucleotidyltransferase